MSGLDSLSVDTLRARLDQTENPKSAQRLRVAIDYKEGDSVERLASRYDITESTVRELLASFEEQPVDQALDTTATRRRTTPQATDSPVDHSQQDGSTDVVLWSHREDESDVWEGFNAIRTIIVCGALAGIAIGAAVGHALGSEAAIGGLGIWFGIAGGIVGGMVASRRYGGITQTA